MNTRKQLHLLAIQYGGTIVTPFDQNLVANYYKIPNFIGYCSGSSIHWLQQHILAIHALSDKTIESVDSFIQFEKKIIHAHIVDFKKEVFTLHEQFKKIHNFIAKNSENIIDKFPSHSHIQNADNKIQVDYQYDKFQKQTSLQKDILEEFSTFIFDIVDEATNWQHPGFFSIVYKNNNEISQNEDGDLEWRSHVIGLITNFPYQNNIIFFDNEVGEFAFNNVQSFIAWFYEGYIPYILNNYDMKFASDLSYGVLPIHAAQVQTSYTLQNHKMQTIDFSKASNTLLDEVSQLSTENLSTQLGRIMYDLVINGMDKAIFLSEELSLRNASSSSTQSKLSFFKTKKDSKSSNPAILKQIPYMPLHEVLDVFKNNHSKSVNSFVAYLYIRKVMHTLNNEELELFKTIPEKTIKELRRILKSDSKIKSLHIEFFAIDCLHNKLIENVEHEVQQLNLSSKRNG